MAAIKLFAYGKSKPGHEKDLRQVVQELVSETCKEQAMYGGLPVYEAYETESPGEFIFHEEYSNQESLDRHMRTQHLQRALPLLKEHLERDYTLWKVSAAVACMKGTE